MLGADARPAPAASCALARRGARRRACAASARRRAPSPTAGPARPGRDEVVAGDREPAVAEVVEPALARPLAVAAERAGDARPPRARCAAQRAPRARRRRSLASARASESRAACAAAATVSRSRGREAERGRARRERACVAARASRRAPRGRRARPAGSQRRSPCVDAVRVDREARPEQRARRGRGARARASAAGCGSRSSSRSSAPSRAPADRRQRAVRPPPRRARPCAGRARTRAGRRSGPSRSSRVGSSREGARRAAPAARRRAGPRAPGPRDQLAVGEVQRDRVDREVAPREVLLERRAEPHVRQRARPRVASRGARPRGRTSPSRRVDGRGAEALVHRRRGRRARSAARARDRDRVALDHEVELARDRGRAARRAPRRRRRARPARRQRTAAGSASRVRRGRADGPSCPTCFHLAPWRRPCHAHDAGGGSAPRRRRGGRASLVVRRGAVFALTRPGDVSNPDVEFHAEPTATAVPDDPPRAKPKGKKVDPLRELRLAGLRLLARTAGATCRADHSLRPPFRRVWTLRGDSLLEFPPVMAGASCSCSSNNGALHAIDKRTGKRVWTRKLGVPRRRLARLRQRARVRDAARSARKGCAAGRSPRSRQDGKILCRSALPVARESSPLFDDDRIYFGSENGTVYALRAGDGAVRWTFKAGGAVKGGLALADGKLYFGDYGGRVYAIAPGRRQPGVDDGHRAARSSACARAASTRRPAVAYGRVYIGNTDGNMYSFASDQRQARVDEGHRAPTSTPRPPSRRCRASSRPSTSAPTTASSTRSTPAPARCAGAPRRRQDLRRRDGRRRHRLLLQLRPRRTRPALGARTGRDGRLHIGRGRVQPGRSSDGPRRSS